tara:strand:- start:905 stop:1783 length:879 start_codon:yes stop_codon:yes gene_type:complete
MRDSIKSRDIYKILESSFSQINEQEPLESWRRKKKKRKRTPLSAAPLSVSGAGGPEADRLGTASGDPSRADTGPSAEPNDDTLRDQPIGRDEPSQGSSQDETPETPEPGPAITPQPPVGGIDTDTEPEPEPVPEPETEPEPVPEPEPEPEGLEGSDVQMTQNQFIIPGGAAQPKGDIKNEVKVTVLGGSWRILNKGVVGDWMADDPKQKFVFTFTSAGGQRAETSQELVLSSSKLKNFDAEQQFAAVWDTFKHKSNNTGGEAIVDSTIEDVPTSKEEGEEVAATPPDPEEEE